MQAPGHARPRPRALAAARRRLRQQLRRTSDRLDHASAADCTPAKLDTHTKGVLTVATDEPAYPPYFVDDDPSQRQGLRERRRLRDRQAARLRQSEGQVDGRAVQLLLRARAQGLRLRRQPDLDHAGARKGRRLLGALLHGQPGGRRAEGLRRGEAPRSLAELKDTKIGVQIGTTSLEAVEEEIDPSSEPQVFNNSNDVVTALKNGQVDAVVVDVPTALYLTAVQVPDATSSASSALPAATSGARCSPRAPRSPPASRGRSKKWKPPANSRSSTGSG